LHVVNSIEKYLVEKHINGAAHVEVNKVNIYRFIYDLAGLDELFCFVSSDLNGRKLVM
jgi:hypothetical protein